MPDDGHDDDDDYGHDDIYIMMKCLSVCMSIVCLSRSCIFFGKFRQAGGKIISAGGKFILAGEKIILASSGRSARNGANS